MEKIRVCIFCECWESGGIESFLYNVLSHTDLTGLDIDIVAAQQKYGVFYDKTKALGVNFIELSGRQKNYPKNYRMFVKLLNERRYHVIHLNIFHAVSFMYGIIAKNKGIPKRIVHSHNTFFRKSPIRFLKILIHNLSKNLFYKVFTDYWSCSLRAAQFMFPKRIIDENRYTFIPNGIDAERFTFSAEKRASFREKSGIGDKALILSIGRLSQQKNQTFLLDAAKCLTEKKTDFKLLLIGDGDISKELKIKADRLGITDNVIFYGTTKDVTGALCGADVLAFPSLFEGLGIVAIEAQAAGLPVVCSEHIPEEAFVTELMTSVSLKVGAEKWAEALIEKSLCERKADAVREIKDKGYDIRSTAELIERTYRGSA